MEQFWLFEVRPVSVRYCSRPEMDPSQLEREGLWCEMAPDFWAKALRAGISCLLVTTGMILADTPPIHAGVACEDFGCVKVELRYDGGRRMRYFIEAYNFRPGHIVANGDIYDSDNQIYIDIPEKTCGDTTECSNLGHFNYPNRCDGQVFELIGTGHRREDPQTWIVEDSDVEIAPMQSSGAAPQQSCQR
jgi:hypothetical protein